jgi:hypothetical protein
MRSKRFNKGSRASVFLSDRTDRHEHIKGNLMKTLISGFLVLLLVPMSPGTGSAQLTATIIGSGSPTYDEDRASASVLISNGDTRAWTPLPSPRCSLPITTWTTTRSLFRS